MNHRVQDDLLVQDPVGTAEQLVLLFHGVGADAADLAPLGHALAPHLRGACIVSVQAPDRSDLGQGYQWFSVQGVTEASRLLRVEQALPRFIDAVQRWQQKVQLNAERTIVVGFSQGAIMALASTQRPPFLCSRLVAIAGRLAGPPGRAPTGMRMHFMHGEEDSVIPVGLGAAAASQLQALGADVTLDRFPGLGHGIDNRVIDAVRRRLQD